jgi:hypothetical protein
MYNAWSTSSVDIACLRSNASRRRTSSCRYFTVGGGFAAAAFSVRCGLFFVARSGGTSVARPAPWAASAV